MRLALLAALLLAASAAAAQGWSDERRRALMMPFTPPATADAFSAWPAPAGLARRLPPAIPGIGTPATPEQIAGWDVAVRGDGHNLPPGRGTAAEGEELYLQHCAACHGDFGEGLERWPALMGGRGSLATDQPRRTIGSFWPHAPVVFDYIRRAMPYQAPFSLSHDEVYAITAFLLYINEIIPNDAEMNAETLRAVRMPNRDGFVLDARPDTPDAACMTNCRGGVAPNITMDSRRFIAPGRGSGFSTPQ
jgi:S-disulfanyl-L-cysteine oxidoreductase SoxD